MDQQKGTPPAGISRGLPDRIVGRLRRDVPLAFLDIVVAFGAYTALLLARAPSGTIDFWWAGFWAFLPIAIIVHLSCNFVFGLYGQMWQHASIQEARRIVLAGIAAWTMIVVWSIVVGGHPVPRTVWVLGPVLAFVGMGGLRFQSRLFAFHRRSAAGNPAEHRVVVFGTGDAAAMILRDIQRTPSLGLRPVALLDDDPRKQGLSIHGIPVVGGRNELVATVRARGATQVLLAVPSATSGLIQDLSSRCEQAQVPLRLLPGVREIVGGTVTARDIRDLRIEDLLGRGQVELDQASLRILLEGRHVLITGAGGSIGSEIARQVAAFDPAVVDLLDHDETHLFEVTESLGGRAPHHEILADVRDRQQMFDVFRGRRPQVVFHAAAHKHVPLMESFPEEAAKTNVLGTANVVDACAQTHVDRFVFVSTDKAIRPTSVMGASKRMAEEVVRGFLRNGTSSCSVRFGNVLGSRGSVIPTFLRQIQAGGPVTVTDPRMTRYFMSIPEAVQLVLQAAAIAHGGEVFTLDMGTPVNIDALARRVIRLAGKVPDQDIEIVYSGVRPGEKLAEDVRDEGEELLLTDHAGIFVTRPPAPDRVGLRRNIRAVASMVGSGQSRDIADLLRHPEAPMTVEAGSVVGA